MFRYAPFIFDRFRRKKHKSEDEDLLRVRKEWKKMFSFGYCDGVNYQTCCFVADGLPGASKNTIYFGNGDCPYVKARIRCHDEVKESL